jgi:hypothetical protein
VLYASGGAVHLSACLLSNNSAASGENVRYGGSGVTLASGGAIHNAGGDVTLFRVEASENSVGVSFLSVAQGGAISQVSGMLSLTECYFHANRARGGSGYGPFAGDGSAGKGGFLALQSGIAQINRCTIANNFALGGSSGGFGYQGPGIGGGVLNAAVLNLENSTITGNEAVAGDGPGSVLKGSGYGGGIYNGGGNVLLTHVTVADNAARISQRGASFNEVEQGGGIFSSNGPVTLRNTILAYNSAGSNCFGAAFLDVGHNISSDPSCQFTAPGSLNNTDPRLGPLSDYGGPTPTMSLLEGSPAIDAADAAFCPSTDQRGRTRPYGDACDIGAFESAPPYTILGRIGGYVTSPGGLSVTAGTSSSMVDSDGAYALHGLTGGSYAVTPIASDAVFVMSNRVVTVGPDIVGLNFYSWRSNALTIERMDGPRLRSVFAGHAGDTWRVSQAADLSGNWMPYSTNTVESSGLFELILTNEPMTHLRLFRTEKP